ncbi:MAG: AAA family ATPase [Thermomicrobiales bacterium]|nr:AAA family ATPase [Thermomicrobiales bacterium]
MISTIPQNEKLFITAQELMEQPKPKWLVKGLIHEGTLAFLSGYPSTGKSFIALELAACICEGKPFFGQEVTQGEVLYVAFERGDFTGQRLEGLTKEKGFTLTGFYANDPYTVLTLDLGEGETQLCEFLDNQGIKPKLIIYDTLRASFEGDENSSSLAQKVMTTMRKVNKRYDSTALVVHHLNQFGRLRGSTAFIGDADTELVVTEGTGANIDKVYLKSRKQNNARKFEKYTLTKQKVELEGDETTIVFNLEARLEEDTSPEEDSLQTDRQRLICEIVNNQQGVMSLRGVSDAMKEETGTEPNRETLKKELRLLNASGELNYAVEGNIHKIWAVAA